MGFLATDSLPNLPTLLLAISLLLFIIPNFYTLPLPTMPPFYWLILVYYY